LLQAGHEIEIVDDLSTGHEQAVPAGVPLHRFCVGNRPALSSLLQGRTFHAVFHFAAKALIPESVVNPGVFFDNNLAAGIAMLEVLRQHNIRTLVFSSTAAVYGSPQGTPIDEDHPKNPMNSYGESKLAFERILSWYAQAYSWSVFAFRYFNASGGSAAWGERHDPETHIIPLLLQVASGRRSHFEIFGVDYATPDGTCLRDYVHVMDIACAHLAALRLEAPGQFRAYNIGTGTSYSVKEVCETVQRVTGRRLDVRPGNRRPGDPAVLCASPARLMKDLAWKPQQSDLESIINGAWQWELSLARSAGMAPSP
jgi:UDP-glucose 4-epimerase